MRIATVVLVFAVGAGAFAVPASPAGASSVSLVTRLDALASEFAGGSAIWVSDPAAAAPVYSRETDREVLAASLYKLAILAEVEHRVELGRLSYRDTIVIDGEDLTADGSWVAPGTELTIDEALELMITLSDNGTAVHLWRMLGGESVNELLRKSGVPGFHVAVDPADDHVVTARSIASFYTLLAKGQLVSAAASARMVERLQRQQINDRIPAQLPEGTKVAHKTGNLIGLVHDAGIVYTPRGPRVIVAMTWDADDATADEFIAHVASAVYTEALTPPVSASYRVPAGTQYAGTGATLTLAVVVENVGPRTWTPRGAGRVGLAWELRDARNAMISRSSGPVALGQVPPGRSVTARIAVTVPRRAGDHTLTIGLVDGSGRALAPLGVATARLVIAARPPVVELAATAAVFAR